MATKEVTSYKLFHIEGVAQKAYVSCWAQGKFQGYIDFYEKEKLPQPRITSNGSLHLAYPIERLEAIIGTLREESPVYITVLTGNFKTCRVSTTDEPVGEEEGS